MKKNNPMRKFLSKFRGKKQLPEIHSTEINAPKINTSEINTSEIKSSDSNTGGWKEKALTDFKRWLDELPEQRPGPEGMAPEGVSPHRGESNGIPMDACDLFTLLTEFTALRQEIKLQNREQNNAIRIHADLVDNTRECATLFRDRTKGLENLEERIRMVCETRTVEPFFDIRDALKRGLEAVRAALDKGIYFRRSSRRRIEGIAEGYEMALRRFDRVLIKFGITPLVSVGQPFNPLLMRAVGKQNDPKKENNIVLEEHLSGFVKGDDVLRIAEVIVNKK